MTPALSVDFAGALHTPDPAAPFTLGREADLVLDADNGFLHRRFLALTFSGGLWWLSNVGGRLTATVTDAAGTLQATLAPGASLPLVFGHTIVWFTAGATTYEVEFRLEGSPFQPAATLPAVDGSATMGRVSLTPAQRLLIVALCEDALRRGNRGPSSIPTSAAAAARLGWPITRFNRKLDNVCDRLAAHGVRGLHGGPERLASDRKARLVEHALSVRLVTSDDLALLDPEDAAPPAASWPHAEAWSAVLGFVPRIVVASLAGYLAGQFLNASVLVRIKRRTQERTLWVRLVTSTLVGELADTVVFCLVAFGPVGALFDGFSLSWPELLNYIAVGWVYKCLVEIALLPVTYRVIAWVKRREPGY